MVVIERKQFHTFNPLLRFYWRSVDGNSSNPKAINVQLSARVMQNYNDFVSGMQMAWSSAYLAINPSQTYSPEILYYIMEPENGWVEDYFPFKMVPFQGT